MEGTKKHALAQRGTLESLILNDTLASPDSHQWQLATAKLVSVHGLASGRMYVYMCVESRERKKKVGIVAS